MYFGCHDGVACVLSDLLIEGNYIHTVRAASDEVGYGMQVKLNSTAVIRDNVIVDTKGPGIMVYGSRDLGKLSVVERNFVASSRTSAGIVIGGGPVVVRNNVAVGNSEGGIGLENYGKRDLLRAVFVVHNSVHGNDKGGITVPSEGRLEATMVNNAVHASPGGAAFPMGRVGVLSLGNVDCTYVPCFTSPVLRDFSPLATRPGVFLGEEWMPRDDYLGRSRGLPPVVGAFEQPAGPIESRIKILPR